MTDLADVVQTEDLTPYIIPPLGKHYLDRWEEEDSDVPPRRHDPSSYISPLEPPVLPRLRPDALSEEALGTEHVFLGPLSERLMAALAVDEVPDVRGEDELDVPTEDGPVPPRLPMDAVDLEERVRRELRYIGILPEEDVRGQLSFSLSACSFCADQELPCSRTGVPAKTTRSRRRCARASGCCTSRRRSTRRARRS